MLALLTGLLSKLAVFNFGAIVPMLNPVGNFIKKYWMFLLPLLLIGTNCATIYEWQHTNHALVVERASHTADNATYKKAQDEANAKAQAERDRLNKESKASATKADAQYSSLYSQYRANLLRYQAAQSGGKQPSDNQLPTAPGSYGPGAGAVILDHPTPGGTLTISLDDANVCAINTARLTAVHDWALSLPKDTK